MNCGVLPSSERAGQERRGNGSAVERGKKKMMYYRHSAQIEGVTEKTRGLGTVVGANGEGGG